MQSKMRWGALLSVLGLSASMLAGCGTSTSSSSTTSSTSTATTTKKVNLNVLYMNQAGYSTSVLKQLGNSFEKKYPNVHVNFTFVPYHALYQKIVTSASASTPTYDVVLSDLIWTANFAKDGYTIPLNGYIHQYIKNSNEIPKAIWNGFIIGKKTMAMPFLANFQNFYYNKKILKAAGFNSPPRTMSQWLHQMEVIKAKGLVKYPTEDSWEQTEGLTCDYVRLAGEYGGKLFNAQGQPVMNSGGAYKALQFMSTMVKKGLINPASATASANQVAQAFAAGKIAFAPNWTFETGVMNSSKTSKIVGQGVVSLFPVAKGTNQTYGSATVSGYQGLAIPANVSKSMRLWAWRWIQYATSTTVQKQHLHSQWPIWTPIAKSSSEKKINPAAGVYLANVSSAYNRPKVANYLHVSTIIQKYLHEMIVGTLTAKQAANDMVSSIKKLKA